MSFNTLLGLVKQTLHSDFHHIFVVLGLIGIESTYKRFGVVHNRCAFRSGQRLGLYQKFMMLVARLFIDSRVLLVIDLVINQTHGIDAVAVSHIRPVFTIVNGNLAAFASDFLFQFFDSLIIVSQSLHYNLVCGHALFCFCFIVGNLFCGFRKLAFVFSLPCHTSIILERLGNGTCISIYLFLQLGFVSCILAVHRILAVFRLQSVHTNLCLVQRLLYDRHALLQTRISVIVFLSAYSVLYQLTDFRLYVGLVSRVIGCVNRIVLRISVYFCRKIVDKFLDSVHVSTVVVFHAFKSGNFVQTILQVIQHALCIIIA